MTQIELSELIRVLGAAYVVGIVIATSGIFPSFGKSLGSKLKYSVAEARIRRQQFGRGANQIPIEDAQTKHQFLVFPFTLLLIALCYLAFNWVENAKVPALNFALGFSSIAMGWFLRKQFLRDWSGSKRKLDFACFLIGLFFFVQKI